MISLHGVHSIPAPLHIEIGDCLNGCKYCFVTSKGKKTSLKSIENAITKEYDGSLKSYYLTKRYPICFNNSSDFFNCKDKDYYFDVMALLKDAGFSFYFQTKGHHNNKDLDRFLKIADKKDVLYITVTGFDKKIKELEPAAPDFKNRKKLIDACLDHNMIVEVGFNPIISKYFDFNKAADFINEYKEKKVTYVVWSLHGVKNLHPNGKEINKLVREERKTIHNKMKQLYDILVANKTPLTIESNMPDIEYNHISNGCHIRDNLNINMLLGGDIDAMCHAAYSIAIEQVGVKEDIVQGCLTFGDFIEIYKEFILDCYVKKSEIRTRDTFLYHRLPDKISYKDYLKLAFENLGIISPFYYSNSCQYEYNNETFWCSSKYK